MTEGKKDRGVRGGAYNSARMITETYKYNTSVYVMLLCHKRSKKKENIYMRSGESTASTDEVRININTFQYS
jgi:hypothetical protein